MKVVTKVSELPKDAYARILERQEVNGERLKAKG